MVQTLVLAMVLAGPVWHAALDAGAGAVETNPAVLLVPRVGIENVNLALELGYPLRGVVIDRSPSLVLPGSEDYPAIVRRLDWQSPGRALRLHAGGLVGESMRHGVLVDGYGNAPDPFAPRAGARLDLETPGVRGAVLVSSAVQPDLVAAQVELSLLHWALASDRLTLGAEAALDPKAPRSGGRRPYGGAAVDITLGLVRADTVGVALYTAVARTLSGAMGAHAGVRFELIDGQGQDGLTLRLEVVRAGHNYTPGYFDSAYALERYGTSGLEPKRELARPTSLGFGGRMDVRAGPLRLIVAGRGEDTGVAHGELVLSFGDDTQKLALTVAQRYVRRPEDVVRLAPTTRILFDGAMAIGSGAYVFASLSHTLAHDGAGPATERFSGFAGLGLAASTLP